MDVVYRCVNGLGRLVLLLLGVRVRVRGAEHLPTSGPVILAATHASYLDFVILEKAAVRRGRYLRFLARHDVWLRGPVGWAMTRMRHVPVDRTVPVAAYLQARRLLRAGEAVGIFPEAGISYSYTVRSLMPGAAALARETGAALVPVALWGAQRITTVGIPDPRPDFTRGRRIDVLIGAPVRVRPEDDVATVTRLLGERLTAQLEELQRLPEHRPVPGEPAPWYPAHLGGQAPTRREAAPYDVVPASALSPTWGPGSDDVRRSRPDLSADPEPG